MCSNKNLPDDILFSLYLGLIGSDIQNSCLFPEILGKQNMICQVLFKIHINRSHLLALPLNLLILKKVQLCKLAVQKKNIQPMWPSNDYQLFMPSIHPNNSCVHTFFCLELF